MKFFLSFIFSLMMLGCSRTVPPKLEYTIASHVKESQLALQSCKDETLKLAQIFTPKYLMETDMSYVIGENEQYTYNLSQWVETPRNIITQELLKTLRKSELFKEIKNFKSRGKYTLLLETNVEEFMQYYTQDEKNSYVKLVFNMSILDAKTDETIASRRFESRVAAKELSAKGGVIALQKALDRVLQQSLLFIQKSCR